MFEIIYVSSASTPIPEPALKEILERARMKNSEAGVSGILLCHGGSFLQVLEGPDEEIVTEVFERIAADRRHHHVLVLKRGPIAERRFAEWRMGYVNVDDVAQGGDPEVAGFLLGGSIEALSPDCEEDLGRAGKLLDAFRGGRYRQ